MRAAAFGSVSTPPFPILHTLAPLVLEGTKPSVPPTRRLHPLNMSEPESPVLLKEVA